MPFNFLLGNHIHHGTSFKENGVNVSMNPKSGETIIFFHLDSGDKSRLRNYLDLDDTSNICDLLIYYFNVKYDKPTICLVELKGQNVKHAVVQLDTIYGAFGKKIKPVQLFSDFSWGAFIMIHKKSSVPQNRKHLLKPLDIKGLKCKTGKKDIEIENFIRNL